MKKKKLDIDSLLSIIHNVVEQLYTRS